MNYVCTVIIHVKHGERRHYSNPSVCRQSVCEFILHGTN